MGVSPWRAGMNLLLVTFSIALLVSSVSSQGGCIPFTTKDVEGPFFVQNVPFKYKVATDVDLKDPTKAAILRGMILDRNCQGIPGATVDIWYAGGTDQAEYTFGPDELKYRGKGNTSQEGSYEFLASFPGTYPERPIPHIHYMVVTPGNTGQTFISQLYFPGQIPPSYENYVRNRDSQFAKISPSIQGGRIIHFDIRLNQ